MKKTKLMSVLTTAVTVFSGACLSGSAQAAGPWNGKAVQPGGGGYDGNIPNTTGKTTLGSGTAPLTLGYMTFADDSGHTAADSNDASFAVNDEALLNFGYMHIKKARDVAFEIARAR